MGNLLDFVIVIVSVDNSTHDMETLSAFMALCGGNPQVPVNYMVLFFQSWVPTNLVGYLLESS